MSRQVGTVKWYSIRKGYGFVTPTSGGEDIFIHRTSFASADAPATGEDGKPVAIPRVIVRPEQEIEYGLGQRDGKSMAINITAKGGESLPPVQRKRKPKKKPEQAEKKKPQQQEKKKKEKKALPKGQGSTTFKVYLDPRSTCSRKVLLTLTEKDLKFDLEIINLAKGEQKSEDHMARHPFGKVPFLEVVKQGRTRPLFESVAICRYLASFNSGEKLIPEDGWNTAVMHKMIAIINETLWPAFFDAYFEKVLKQRKDPKAKADGKKVEASRKATAAVLAVVEKQIGKSRFLAGRFYSLADVTAMPYFSAFEQAGCNDLLKDCPMLTKWWSEVSARPAWKAALQFSNGL